MRSISLPSLTAAKQSDVLICAADNPTAHLATAILAKLYLKPLLDLGTGVLAGADGARRAGADVRLILPDRCPMCFGGTARFEQARRGLLEVNTRQAGGSLNWQRERAGSLRSLNMIAAGHALRLLEELATGRIRASAWISLEYGRNGLPLLTTPEPQANDRCSVCRFTGHGDQGIIYVKEMLTGV